MRKKNRVKTIMLLPPTVFPIPAVGGGAVEQLITHLLDVNEIEQKARFVLVSKYDKRAAQQKYRHSDVLYLNDNEFVIGYEKFFRICWGLYRVWLKVFHNHIAERVFRWHHVRMDTYSFQCAILAKMKHVDMVVNELHDFGNDAPLTVFNSIVGSERFYNHIHTVRNENLQSRNIIRNSISISRYVRNHWVIDKSIPGINEVLYNCIDVDRFAQPLSDSEHLLRRQKLGIAETDFVVLYCGRLVPYKGVAELLDAFDLLAEQRKENIKLLFIGSADFSNGNMTDFSRGILEKANKNTNVIPIGYIPNNEIPKYYALADAQVVPSTWQEGAGLVAIEGMATGLPLIVTKSGGMSEYVGEGTAIQLPIDENLVGNIVDAILQLVNNPKLCKELGNEGKLRAKQFSREAYYKGFLEIVDRASGEQGSR